MTGGVRGRLVRVDELRCGSVSEANRIQPPATLVVRRHWGVLRTPWVIRRLRKLPAPDGLPCAYRYDGRAEDAAAFADWLVAQTRGFTTDATGLSADQRVRRRRSAREGRLEIDPSDVVDAGTNFIPSGGGGGDFDGWLAGADDFALIVVVLIVAAVLLVIAVPLGLIAIELAVALIIGAAVTAARVAGLKPWLLLIKREGRPVAAVAVRGWRASQAVIAALRTRMR